MRNNGLSVYFSEGEINGAQDILSGSIVGGKLIMHYVERFISGTCTSVDEVPQYEVVGVHLRFQNLGL